MRKAGFIQHARTYTIDDDGRPNATIELSIRGYRYGIRVDDIRAALDIGLTARVERIRQNWQPYFAGVAGTAQRSRSGRALNIEMSGGARFTVSLDAVRAVLARSEVFAAVAEIPGFSPSPHPVAAGQRNLQQNLFAFS